MTYQLYSINKTESENIKYMNNPYFKPNLPNSYQNTQIHTDQCVLVNQPDGIESNVVLVDNTTDSTPIYETDINIETYTDYVKHLKILDKTKYSYIKYIDRLENTKTLLNENKEAFFVLGGPATGKSGAVEATEKKFNFNMNTDEHFIYLNTDDVMELLPQYIKGYDLSGECNTGETIYVDKNNADISHEKAKMFADEMYKEAVAKNFSIVFDGTGNNKKKLREKILKLVNCYGYTVTIVHTLLDVNIALSRGSGRAYSSRRFVPDKVIRDSNPGTDKDDIATLICLPNIPLYFLDTSKQNTSLEKYTYSDTIVCPIDSFVCPKDKSNYYFLFSVNAILIVIALYMYFTQTNKKKKKKV